MAALSRFDQTLANLRRQLKQAMRPPWKGCSRRGNEFAMLWEVDVHPAPGQPDMAGRQVPRKPPIWAWPRSGRRRRAGISVEGAIDAEQIGLIAANCSSTASLSGA